MCNSPKAVTFKEKNCLRRDLNPRHTELPRQLSWLGPNHTYKATQLNGKCLNLKNRLNSCKPSIEKKTGKKTPNFYISTKVAWYSMEIWVHMEEYTREEEHWKGRTDRSLSI